MLFLGIYEGGKKDIFYAGDFSIYNLLIFCLAKARLVLWHLKPAVTEPNGGGRDQINPPLELSLLFSPPSSIPPDNGSFEIFMVNILSQKYKKKTTHHHLSPSPHPLQVRHLITSS